MGARKAHLTLPETESERKYFGTADARRLTQIRKTFVLSNTKKNLQNYTLLSAFICGSKTLFLPAP
jgi:hypothetical protein